MGDLTLTRLHACARSLFPASACDFCESIVGNGRPDPVLSLGLLPPAQDVVIQDLTPAFFHTAIQHNFTL